MSATAISNTSVSVIDLESPAEEKTRSTSPTLSGDDENKDFSRPATKDIETAGGQDVEPALKLSATRKFLILSIVSCAQFFDIYNACAAIIALPTVCSPPCSIVYHRLTNV